MTHKDLDGNKVNMNRALYQMFLYPGSNNPEIMLSVRNETAQCASCSLGYKAGLVTVVWLLSRIVYREHTDEQRHLFIHFPSDF